MLRRDIVNGMKNVIDALRNEPMDLGSLMHMKGAPPDMSLEMFRSYLLKADKYGSVEKQIIEIYRLSFLTDIKFWTQLLLRDLEKSPEQSEIRDEIRRLRFVQETLYGMLSLLEQEPIR